MSINVTVSGNPVRINRGKMVTAFDPSKTEFEKRRLMRLEQVRQQSKDIAENVRNNIKKQKAKCLTQVEKDGEVQLKNWQARKLLELQDQYQEALDELGLGHKDALQVQDEEEVLDEQRESNERIARDRGRMAAERLQIERNEESLRRAVPKQRKVLTSDVETRRANAVRTGKKAKSPFKKKKQVFDSDGENKVPQLEGLGEDWDGLSGSSEEEVRRKRSNGGWSAKTSKEQQTSATIFQIPTSDKAAQTSHHDDQEPVPQPTREFFLDTRISERIKRRTKLNPEVDYCDVLEKSSPTKLPFCTCCKCPMNHPHGNATDFGHKTTLLKDDKPETTQKPEAVIPEKSEILFEGDRNLQTETEKTVPEKSQNLEEDKTKNTKSDKIAARTTQRPSKKKDDPKSKSTIPAKPKITLRPTKDRPVYIGTDPKTQPVQFYDHPNRYSRSYVPKTTHVEKIDDQEIVVSPNLSEDEIREKMRQRDIEAHVRGQAALEKEKVQREYRDLLKKLPALQKQERIFEIGADKEKYHMSRDRLEDLEKRRQNRLDNAYEELFVRQRPAVVTLPKRKGDREEGQSLNLAAWDVDFDPDVSNQNRSDKLSRLLSNLKSQKESLLKEIESTLSREKLTKRSDRYDVKSKSTDYTRSKKRKRTTDERPVSPTSSDIIAEESETQIKSKKSSLITATGTTSSPSPRKKAKLKTSKRLLVLQNTSTQTSPVLETQSVATSPISKTPTTEEVCPCVKGGLDDLCEIIIKIKENEKPEVQVNPPFLGTNVKVVTEEAERSKKKSESPKKSTSWKNQLVYSSSTQSSSSTTYKDPPPSLKTVKTPEEDSSRWSSHKSKSSTLEDFSKSLNSIGPDGRIDPRLLTYIKKLLSMSRASIDELTASTASDISTPSHSVIETPANNPLLQLVNVMKYFKLDVAEVQKQLSYVSDGSSKRYSTSENTTLTSSTSDKSEFKSCTEITDEVPNKKLLEYADIAASCTEKINNLTAMIEKVRAEKKKMIESSTSGSERDLTTTSYKDLPEEKAKDELSTTLPETKEKKSPKDELDKLLTIDYGYAEQLKQLSQEEIRSEKKRAEEEQTDQLLNRLQKLLDDNKNKKKATPKHRTLVQETDKKVVHEFGAQPVVLTSEKKVVESAEGGKTAGAELTKTTVKLTPGETEEPPLFLDIPKLPRLEASSLGKKKKRPPTSKGMRAIAANAHELSTIVEADSQMKVESPKNQSSSSSKSAAGTKSSSSDDVSEMDTMETMLMSIGMEWAIPTLKKTREALAMTSSSSGSKDSGELSLREFLSKISTSSSKSDEGSMLSESQGMSLIQADNRRTSTPIINDKKEGPIFVTDSDMSSVREHSDRQDSQGKFFDLNEGSVSKSR